MSKRTLVDDYVKSAMLRHFTLYPTREHVLVNLFFTSNGYYWQNDQDGYAVPVTDYPDDSAEGILTHEEEYPSVSEQLDLGDDYARCNKVDIEFQNMVRDWARRHIDVISTRGFHFYDFRLPAPSLFHRQQSRLLASLPDNIHPEWIWAINEICLNLAARINADTMAHSFNTRPEMDAYIAAQHPQYDALYRAVRRTLNHLNGLPLIAKANAEAHKIVEEILAEEAAKSD